VPIWKGAARTGKKAEGQWIHSGILPQHRKEEGGRPGSAFSDEADAPRTHMALEGSAGG